jgi:hypothetical protein
MKRNDGTNSLTELIVAQYQFNDANNIGKDSSQYGNHATAEGSIKPVAKTVGGRNAVTLSGGVSGTSFLKLPSGVLEGVTDHTGLTVSTWLNLGKGSNVWERIFDFGKGESGPYLFLTRNLRGNCFAGSDLIADAGRTYSSGEWLHVAMTVRGTEGGTLSSAGPVIYVNGEIVADGSISQTSSGTYAKLREWFETLTEQDNYSNNFIGKSQFDADADFCGSLSDFRVYKTCLTEDEVIEVMCETLSDGEIVKLARDKYLSFPITVVSKDVRLPEKLMGEKVAVTWKSSNPSLLSEKGKIGKIDEPEGVTLTAVLQRN